MDLTDTSTLLIVGGIIWLTVAVVLPIIIKTIKSAMRSNKEEVGSDTDEEEEEEKWTCANCRKEFSEDKDNWECAECGYEGICIDCMVGLDEVDICKECVDKAYPREEKIKEVIKYIKPEEEIKTILNEKEFE